MSVLCLRCVAHTVADPPAGSARIWPKIWPYWPRRSMMLLGMGTRPALAWAPRPRPVYCPTRQPPPCQPPPYLPGKRWVTAPEHSYPGPKVGPPALTRSTNSQLSWWVTHGQIWSVILKVLHIQRNLFSDNTLLVCLDGPQWSTSLMLMFRRFFSHHSLLCSITCPSMFTQSSLLLPQTHESTASPHLCVD